MYEGVGLASFRELRLNPLSQLRNGRGGKGGGNRQRVNCVRDAKSDQMKNEQQTAVIDDQNGEEERGRGRRTAKGSRKARREGGRGNKAGDRKEGRATVDFNEDLGDEIINSWAYLS